MLTVKKYLKKWLVNFCVLLFVIFFGLVVIELGVRFYEKTLPPPRALSIFDNETYYLIKPNLDVLVNNRERSFRIKTNSEGFRDDEFDMHNTSEKPILMLGDSFTFGLVVEVNETFSNLIEEETLLPVFNLGIGGFTTFQEYVLLKRYYKKYKPKTVILNIFLGNDIAENIGIINRSLNRPRVIQKYRHNSTIFEKFKTFFRETLGLHSYLFFAKKFDNLLRNLNLKPPLRLNTFTLKLFDKNSLDDAELKKGYEKTFNYVNKIKRLTEENDINFFVVLIPIKFQIRDSLWERTIRKYWSENKEFSRDLPNQVFRSFFEKENIEYLDLYETFREAAKKEKLYYDYDQHWNPKGHKLAAKEIIKKLVSLNIINEK